MRPFSRDCIYCQFYNYKTRWCYRLSRRVRRGDSCIGFLLLRGKGDGESAQPLSKSDSDHLNEG